jgi:hypothetical protein
MKDYENTKQMRDSTLDEQVMKLGMLYGIPAVIESAVRLARKNGVNITLDKSLSEMSVDALGAVSDEEDTKTIG